MHFISADSFSPCLQFCELQRGTASCSKAFSKVPSPGIGFVLAAGAVDFCNAVRLWETRIIFALRARKEQIFNQHLNHLSSGREEVQNTQRHARKLTRVRRRAAWGIFYLCKLDLSTSGTIAVIKSSLYENPKYLSFPRLLVPLSSPTPK